jgi:hypothetical protein
LEKILPAELPLQFDDINHNFNHDEPAGGLYHWLSATALEDDASRGPIHS